MDNDKAAFLSRTLTIREVFWFFLLTTGIYIFPIIHADYLFYDDQWRALSLPDNAWVTQGRLWVDLLYRILTFTHGTPNIFPLPLLLASLAMAWALSRLTLHFYPKPDIGRCLVALPLWYSPFFLGNLTYQYDGPAMTLAVVAVIGAFTFRTRHSLLNLVLPGILISVALGLYQSVLGVFIGLCAVDLLRRLTQQQPFHALLSGVLRQVLQLLAGAVFYYLTCYQFYASDRGVLLAFDAHWTAIVLERLDKAMALMGLLITEGNWWFVMILLLAAGAGYVLAGWRIVVARESIAGKFGVFVLYVATLPVLFIAVPGIRLLFVDSGIDARNLMGFTTVLVCLFFLSHQVLERILPRLGLFLCIPLLGMLSFAYAYGQVLNAKKELELSIVHDIGYDLTSRAPLREIRRFYLIGPGPTGNWIPGSHGAMTRMPALRFILSDMDQMVIAERLPRIGITQVAGWWARKDFKSAVADKPHVQWVDNRFYQIYQVGDEGYIVLTKITEPEAYTAQPE